MDDMMGSMRVGGSAHIEDRLVEVCAELHAGDLLEALKSAVAGAPHWRAEAQALLRDIANGARIPEPR